MLFSKLPVSLIVIFLFSFSPFANAQTDPTEAAVAHLEKTKKNYNLSADDLTYIITDNYTDRHNGVTHLYLRQQYAGINLPQANADIHLLPNGEVLTMHNKFIPQLADKINTTVPLLTPEAAVLIVAAAAKLAPQSLTVLRTEPDAAQTTVFAAGEIALQEIKAKLVYQPAATGTQIRLAWQIDLYEAGGQNWWNSSVDAVTGEILVTRNQVLHCDFGKGNASCQNHTHTHAEHVTAATSAKNENAAAVMSGYRVFPLGIESPSHGARQLLNNVHDATASPFGWHDVNGSGGADFTITRGNNVYAYEDQDGDNIPGFSPDGGAALEFDFTLDFSQDVSSDGTAENLSSSVTNLFYWNNIIHDVLYQYGFDEVSGNFQQNNYGNGGSGGDQVLAETQDGSGTNNANFSTPADGGNGRMQMFLWTNGGAATTDFTVNGPAAAAGNYTAVTAQFGDNNYNLTGNLVLADDGTAAPTEACNPLTNGAAMNGNIALIDRGSCEFGTKCLNAQNAGAVAVVVCNNVSGVPFVMSPGNDGGAVTIPAIMISQADCATIRAEFPGTINVTLQGTPAPQDYDSSFDNGIVIHEYGHGVSTRLTGGPATGCLSGQEQQGEGWSDYLGLMLTTDFAAANKNDVRGIGTYVLGEPTDGGGIRTHPYSYDMSINPHTYADIAAESIPHGVGSVWCAMLWDLTWDLIEEEGTGTNDIYFGSTGANRGGGQNIALRLVLDGMKLQGCNPTFEISRDAILAADEATYGGDYKCLIWEAFARRGLGASASSGTTSRSDGIEAFDTPSSLLLTITNNANTEEAEEGETVNYSMVIKNRNCATLNGVTMESTLPAGLTYVPGSANNGGNFSNGSVVYPPFNGLVPVAERTYTFSAVVAPGASVLAAPATAQPVNDDVESGTGIWTTNAAVGNSNFSISNAFPRSGSSSWFAPNSSVSSDMTLTSTEFLLEGCPTLTFSHAYNFELPWDGGTVEISTDNGSTWQQLDDEIVQNGYPAAIAGNAGHALAGGGAYTGNSNGYVTTIINLFAYSEQNVRIRFRVASDTNTTASGANVGWYIDDIIVDNNTGITTNAVTSFSGIQSEDAYCLHISGLALPVELKDLTATPHDEQGHIAIDWTTLTEVNNREFELQRSKNGNYFTSIATVAGRGTSESAVDYQYLDERAEPGVVYFYRLLQRDFDGTTALSKVVSAALDKDENTQTDFILMPNPAQEKVTIAFANPIAEAWQVQVYNAAGQIVLQKASAGDAVNLDVSGLEAGVYFTELSAGEERFYRKLVVWK